MTRLLRSVGPGKSMGMGLVPIGWIDLRAWALLTGAVLAPWQAEALVSMSRAYVSEYHQASDDAVHGRPWVPEEDKPAKKAEMAEGIKSGFRAMMRAAKK